MMTFIQKIIDLIQSWLNKKAKDQEIQIKTETAREELIVETIKETHAEAAVEMTENVTEALIESQEKHKKESKKYGTSKKKLDDQFGSNW